jgi:O-antigen/teichoic acid export membrane protein
MTQRETTDGLKQDTLWMFCAQVLRAGFLSVTFVLIARFMGASQLGVFVSVAAGVSLLAPFANWGTGNLMVKNVTRDATTFGASWGNALLVSMGFGCVFAAVVVLAIGHLFSAEVTVRLVVLVCISDLVFAKVIEASIYAFQAVRRFGFATLIYVLWALFRMLSAVSFLISSDSYTATRWATFYLAGSVASAVLAFLLVCRILGRPRPALGLFGADFRQGFYFSASLSAQTIHNDADKTMLARLSTLEGTGIYAAAYRIVDMAFLPVASLMYAAYPRFFQHGAQGIRGSAKFAARLLPRTLLYGAAVSAGLFVAAPALPLILGNGYLQSVHALRWLAPLPFFKTLHYFAGDTLTGSGHQGWRTLGQGAVVACNVVGNLCLIPRYSWKGAAWMSLASDLLLAVILWAAVLMISARSRADEGQRGTSEPCPSRNDLAQIECSEKS